MSCACVSAGQAFALSPQEIQKEPIHNSISVTLTPHGQEFFKNHFQDVLLANGFALDEGGFAKWKYTAKEEINLDHLPITMNGIRTTLGNLRDLIQEYIGNYKLNNPKLEIEVDGIKYSAQFGHFGIRVDPKSTEQLNQTNSVVLDLEIELKSLSVSAEHIRANDLNNEELLGEVGMNSFQADLQAPPSLKFRVPLQISADPSRGLQVKALSIETNLPAVNIDWSFQRPLELPDYEIMRKDPKTGQLIPIADTSSAYQIFEEKITEQSHELAKAMQVYLKIFLAENGSDMINGILQENHYASIIEDVNEMAPIAAPKSEAANNFLWGMIPSEVKLLNDGTFEADLDGFVEDPRAPRPAALPTERAQGAPDLSHSPSSNYDVSLSINEQFVNRLLQLSFNRGYFSKMPLKGQSQSITLTDAPYFKLDSSVSSPKLAKLHVAIEMVYTPDNWVDRLKIALAVHNPIRASFDIITSIKTDSAKGQLELVLKQIDTNSLLVDPKCANWLFYGKVTQAIHSQLQSANKNLSTGKVVLGDPFDVPRGIFGIPIRIQDVQTDSTGHFNIFAELKQ